MTSQPSTEPAALRPDTPQGHTPPPERSVEKQNPWEQIKPWRGKAARTDRALLATILGMFTVLLVMWPLRPLLIADHPVLLALVTGSKTSIGAAAAYARIGEIPLWVAIAAGTVGIIKINWVFWWTGRRWGRGMIDMFATTERAQRLADRLQNMNPWLVRIAVALCYLPGIPRVIVYGVAGWTGMRLGTFLVLDTLAATALTSVVAGCGYTLGQDAVDVIVAIDDYAIWITIAIAVALPFVPMVRARLGRAGKRGTACGDDGGETEESTRSGGSPA